MSQKDITQNPKACQEKCKKNSWINFVVNSVIFVLTKMKRALLGKHSAKCTVYLFRQVFLHERLHWEKKKKVQQKPLEGALQVFVVIPLEGALAGAVAEQGSEPLCWAEAGTEDGEGRGLPTEEMLVLQSRASVQHQNLCSDLQRPGLRTPRGASLWDLQSHSERVWADLKVVLL